jgi:pSer/pThr/pTyr-binding forkhead associated (FHA) protein
MSESVSTTRARAGRIAKWLVEKERPDEAVLILSAWAALGPNDDEGHALLADALRIDPGAKAAQMAFERMESVSGDHALLDEAITRFNADELVRLERELRKPTFRRAQMGFNNNIKSKGQVFHVQTEDSGLDAPHIITHLFADGGRVIKSHKRSYSDAINTQPDIATYVRGLMKAQHMEMVLALRDGQFDAIIEGREIGGMVLLTELPREDAIKNLSRGKRSEAKPRTSVNPADQQQALYTLVVTRSLTGGPAEYKPTTDVALIGSRGAIPLPGERFCHAEEAMIVHSEGRLTLEDLDGGNGVFLRVRSPVALEIGDEFVVGDQLLRLEQNPIADDGPDPDPSFFLCSPKWPSAFRVLQVAEGGGIGACVVARGNTLQIGSAIGDLLFAEDPLVDPQHCIVEEQAGVVVLTDLGSRSGLFVRVRGESELHDGDELLVGRTRLRVQR